MRDGVKLDSALGGLPGNEPSQPVDSQPVDPKPIDPQPVDPHAGTSPTTRGRALSLAVPAALFLLALGLRLWFVCKLHSPADHVFSDMWVYDHRAHDLMAGDLDAWDTFTPVGYPAFLALVYQLGGSPLTVGVLQSVLGASTTLLTWALARRIFSSRLVALGVGVVSAVHVAAVFYTGLLLTETLFSFLVVASTWVLTLAIERRSWLGLVVAGLLLGCGATVRPNLLVFLPCVPVLVWLGSGRQVRAALMRSLALVAAFVVPVGVAAAHNAHIIGHPTLGTNGGLNFYLNFAAVRGVRYREGRREHGITPIPNLIRYPNDEVVTVPFYADAHYYGRGLALLREHPARLLIGLSNLVEASGAGRQGYWPEADRERWTRLDRRIFYGAGIIPALVGIALLCWRRRFALAENLPLVIGAALVLSSIVTLLFFLGDPRMRVPFDPLFMLLAASAFSVVGEALARKLQARFYPERRR